MQWLDDLSSDEETETTYQDRGGPILTQVRTRAITFGDFYSYKTGLNVEFEFDESVADEVFVQVILDGVIQRNLIELTFSSLSSPQLRIPFTIPATLPASPGLLRKAFDLQRYGTFRELQFQITTNADKLALRSIRVTGFIDTLRLQTLTVP